MLQHAVKIEDIITIAKDAGYIAMRFYDRGYSVEEKENKTPITDADRASHDFLVEKLAHYGFPIISEEGLVDGNDLSHTWVIDPLDGTSDFIQKTGEFSIMIGLVDAQGASVMGIVYASALGELYYAEKNKGAYICHSRAVPAFGMESGNPVQIHVSDKSVKNGTILVSRNHLGQREQEIAHKYHMTQIPMGSAGLKMCRIARGDAQLYINSSDKSGIWDICAADVILREAGGVIADMNGKRIIYNGSCKLKNGYIVTNSKM
jgi:3'(2'), 5'-bisphosphate nucleotidase